jgi:hypothetical protein
MVLKLHALRRTAANRIDVASRLSVRTTAACRLFPSGVIRVHARRTAIAFPSRPGMTPGTVETSQVPRKELLYVRKVSDCARFFPCKSTTGIADPQRMKRC